MEWKAQAFESRPSLWALVKDYAPEEEQLEIKQVLGEDLVDETVDLHSEVNTLLEIWTDYREDTEELQRESFSRQPQRRLPEPPLVRENLEREIKLFVDCLKQRNNDSGQVLKKVLTRKDSTVLDHVLEKAEKQRPESSLSKRPNSSSSRPQTATTRDGRQTPLRATPSSDGSRCASSLSDSLDCMQDRINALDIDSISQHLRDLLEDEKQGLLEDIQFLQDCLEEESEYRIQLSSSPPPEEPSIKELRDIGTKLEKELLSQPNGPIPSPSISSPSRHLPPERNPLVRSTSLDPMPPREVTSPSSPLVPKPPTSPPEKSSYARHHGRGVASVTIRRVVPSPPSSAAPRNPSPPTSARLARPGAASANKFRKMVIDCRENGK